MRPLYAPVLTTGFFHARGVNLFLQIVDLAIKLAHGVHRLVHAFNQSLALRIGELQLADAG